METTKRDTHMQALFSATYLPELSDIAKAFLRREPELLGLVMGHYFYEDPVHGDESPLWMISPEGKLKRTCCWEVPEANDFPFV